MKRIYALLLVLALTLSLGACSKRLPDEEAAPEEKVGEELTLKAATEKGTRVFYTTQNIAGRNTVVDGVYYFKDGKVTAYIARLFGREDSPQLGTLEDYYELSDEEAIKLAKERYQEMYSSYADIESREADLLKEYEGREEELPDWGSQKAAYDSAVAEFKDAKITERDPADFDYVMLLDDSGNNVSVEAVRFQYEIEKTWKGQIATHTGGVYLYVTIDPYEEATFLAAGSDVAPFEVYDCYFGGYEGQTEEKWIGGRSEIKTIYMLTKCSEGTSFSLDEPGTSGIEVLN